jgi:hypothetical protein
MKSRARNKLTSAPAGPLIVKSAAGHYSAASGADLRSTPIAALRSTLFTTELEEVIEIIARERVYRAMLDRLGRRLRLGPPAIHDWEG